MKEFRERLERNTKIFAIICCLFPTALLIAKFASKSANDFSQGTALGACVGSMVVVIYYLVRNFTALRDEEKLKKLYIEQSDERNIEISKETLRISSTICVVLTGLASIIAGFINIVVSMTLAAALIISVIITLAVQAYVKKNM